MVEALRNSRLQKYGTTVFTQMSALAAETRSINLGQGFPDTDGPREVAEAAANAVMNGPNQYPPLLGEPDLRAAIAEHQKRFYNMTVDPQTEVLVTAGATEGIAASMIALCEPGDEVVVFEPSYDSYPATIDIAAATKKTVLLAAPDHALDVAALEAAISPRTRILLLNTPHNPTGKVFTIDELGEIAGIAIKNDLIVVSDEVYEHMVFDGTHIPIATLPGMAERTVTISSAGKTFAFTGWKIGWVIAPQPIRDAIKVAKQFLTFTNGAPFQPAVAVGLRLGDVYFRGLRDELIAKRDRLAAGLTAAGFAVLHTEGTYFLTADLRPYAEQRQLPQTSIEFCLALPERAGVVGVPSEVFYVTKEAGRSLVRFAFCKQPDILDAAIERLTSSASG